MAPSSSPKNAMHSGDLRAHAIRLLPGEDLIPALQSAARKAMTKAAFSSSCMILTAVGSLSQVTIRLAGASASDPVDPNKSNSNMLTLDECVEIVSLVGTLTPTDKHLHISCADAKGKTVGGHLVAGKVHTTVELCLGTIEGVAFDRVQDSETGYRELTVQRESCF